ncbi:MAG: hypothetical protein KDK75_23055 [Alphaproteobacteria bacterium]|nr:hypothetical protein [Alphaproteobacteria bacterium]
MIIVSSITVLLAKLFGRALAGPTGPLGETSAFHFNDGAEDQLIGLSDTDARWYYERKRWRS